MKKLALLAISLVLMAGCARPARQVEVGSGILNSGPWSAWVYDSYTSGVCVEIRRSGRAPDRLCHLNEDNARIWRPTADEGDAALLAGTTADATAAVARVTLNGGEPIEAEVRRAAGISSLGFFVVMIPAAADTRQLELLDDRGAVLESQPLE